MKTQEDNRTTNSNGDGATNGQLKRGTLRTRNAALSEVETTAAPVDEEISATPLEVASNGHSNGFAQVESATAVAEPEAATLIEPQTATEVEPPSEPELAPDTRRRVRIRSSADTLKDEVKPDATPVAVATSVLDTPAPSGRSWLTLETGLYLLFFVVAIVTRFWALGDRALHHDESLHATYSWYFFIGNGYTHDPMMHGPFQFHVWGFFYFLLGDSDFSVRVPPALLGIITVMSPFFLRKWVGRGAALMMSFLFLVSPGFLYFSRFAREDAYVMGAEAVLIIGLIGFIATRKPGYFYMFMVVLSILFAIKETAYITTFIFFTLFIPLFFWQFGKRYFGLLALYGVAAGGLFEFMSHATVLRANPADPSKMLSYPAFAMPQMPPGDNPQLDQIFNYFGELFGNPIIWSQLILFAVFSVSLGYLIYSQRRQLIDDDEFGRSFVSGIAIMLGGAIVGSLLFWFLVPMFQPLWFQPAEAAIGVVLGLIGGYLVASNQLGNLPRRSMLLAYPAGSLPQIVGTLLARPSVLFIGVGGFLAIFFVFFTSLFENIPKGIGTGAVGAIGYWISQQPVARGGQPWFYYLLLVPLYEIISVFFSIAALIYFGGKGFNWALNGWRVRQGQQMRQARPVQAVGFVAFSFNRPSLGNASIPTKVAFGSLKPFLILFFAWWLIVANIMYGWAGEKMPWLEVHVDQPAVYLSGIFLAVLFSSVFAWHRKRQAEADGVDENVEGAADAATTVSATRVSVSAGINSRAGAAVEQKRFVSNPRSVAIAVIMLTIGLVYSLARGDQWLTWLSGLLLVLVIVGTAIRYYMSGVQVAPPVQPKPIAARPTVRPARVAANRREATQARQEIAPQNDMLAPINAWLRPGSWLPFVAFIVLYVILAFAFMFNMASRSYDLQDNKASPEWGIVILYPIFMLLLFIGFAVWRGLKNAAQALLVSIFVIMLFYQMRTGVALAYQNGDVAPMEMAVYVQTGHDLVNAVKKVENYQIYRDGQLDMPVIYDSDFSWPGQWYLRNFTQKRFMPSGPLTITDTQNVPFMFLGTAYHDPGNAQAGIPSITDQYVAQQYVLRWWFDEQIYRNFIPNNAQMPDGTTLDISKNGNALQNIQAAFATIGTLRDPAAQARLWRYLIYREPYPTGNFAGNSVDFKLYVRKDIYQEFNELSNK